MDFKARLTPETASKLLRGAGVTGSPEEVPIAARDKR